MNNYVELFQHTYSLMITMATNSSSFLLPSDLQALHNNSILPANKIVSELVKFG